MFLPVPSTTLVVHTWKHHEVFAVEEFTVQNEMLLSHNRVPATITLHISTVFYGQAMLICTLSPHSIRISFRLRRLRIGR